MDDFERLALAALLHDLPALLRPARVSPAAPAQRVLRLAQLDDPALGAILQQAEAAALHAEGTDLVTDRPLRAIVSRVALHDAEPPPAYYALAPLPAANQPQDALFPTTAPDLTRRHAYLGAMLDALDQLAGHVDLTRFEHAYAHLLAWLQRYGWCLPAHSDDVALFDHARLASAIAACLYRYHEADLSADAIAAGVDAERFCLLVGDLSGIQRYIFDITSIGPGGVARRLRARSFYLGALAEALGHQIAQRFKVPLGNVIMASGGKFYVLVANSGTLDADVTALRREVDAWLHENFNGEIAINLAHICFASTQFQAGRAGQPGFGGLVSALNRMLSREKRRRGQGVLLAGDGWHEDAFVLRERSFWGAGVCISCEKFPAVTAENLCFKCARDVALGRQLPRAAYVAYYHPNALGGDIPLALGWSVRLLDRDELDDAGEPYLVARLNNPQIDELAHLPGTFRFLANHVPLATHGGGMSFEEIADQARGRPLLGYVKADVDQLGMQFAQGLRRDGDSYDTAAHIAALSRELDLFFSGWVQHLLSRKPDYRSFYTIFSGGDDLFLVGPWDKAAQLAIELRAQFGRFAGGNPDLSLSAGIVFTKERYPISRAATDADAMLERAKEHLWTDAQGKERTRDQLAVLGETLRWDIAPQVFAQIATLQERAGLLTSAFLYDMIEYGRLYRLWQDERKIEGLRYKALFAYNIARNLRKGDAEIYRWADELMRSLQGAPESLTMRYLGLVATYVLFARRGS